MYNFYSQHSKEFRIIFILIALGTLVLFIGFGRNIFANDSVYFYTFSTIVQGFVALVAFLGTLAIFKINLEDQAMQKLTDGVQIFIRNYHGLVANTYTPYEMMRACEEILRNEDNLTDREPIERTYKKMSDTLATRNETRTSMVNFAIFSFINIALALLFLSFGSILETYWHIGRIVLSVNILISMLVLKQALDLVRTVLGYDFKKTL